MKQGAVLEQMFGSLRTAQHGAFTHCGIQHYTNQDTDVRNIKIVMLFSFYLHINLLGLFPLMLAWAKQVILIIIEKLKYYRSRDF